MTSFAILFASSCFCSSVLPGHNLTITCAFRIPPWQLVIYTIRKKLFKTAKLDRTPYKLSPKTYSFDIHSWAVWISLAHVLFLQKLFFGIICNNLELNAKQNKILSQQPSQYLYNQFVFLPQNSWLHNNLCRKCI